MLSAVSSIQEMFERVRRAAAEGRADEATRLAEELAAGHASDGTTLCRAAGALLALNRPDRAIEVVERAAGILGQTAEVLHVRGGALLSLGRRPEAVADLRKVVELAPGNWAARLLLAKVLHLSGLHPECLATCGPALTAMPGQEPFASLAIKSGAALGDTGAMFPVLRDAVDA